MTFLLQKFLLAFIPIFVAVDPDRIDRDFYWAWGQPDRPKTGGTRPSSESSPACVSRFFSSSSAKPFLRAVGITVGDFQIAGGLILLVLAVRELVGGQHDRGAGEILAWCRWGCR